MKFGDQGVNLGKYVLFFLVVYVTITLLETIILSAGGQTHVLFHNFQCMYAHERR